ncbi:MarR family winged helix-turn-helix transcriptional regulator [Paenibacillus sp. GCM10023252]|uniref:MarR family winged helix-turn-helix transcriptional regulator n=1 Tax=Paenibacillus sp. GCM10023252 TaxID=3252649 RepID=UPI00361F8C12
MPWESSKILYQLLFLNKQISPKFERCTGISPTRLELLHHLVQADEISQTTLQREVNIDLAAITRHLQQLEAAGMVERRKSTSDNRMTLVRLTDKGREQIISYRIEKDEFVNKLLHGFNDEECQQFAAMLSRMQHNLSDL